MGRGGGSIDKEQAKLNAATAQLCTAHVDQAVMRLKITGGCSDSEISYEYNGNNVNENAPVDKHCHVFDPAGAGETACGLYSCTDSMLGSLSAGEQAACGAIYVSDTLGSRLYTTIADQGKFNWDDAQATCNSLGDDWHLPSLDELNELYLARGVGSLSGTFIETGIYYWSSTPVGNGSFFQESFNDGGQSNDPPWSSNVLVRCVRS